MNPGCWQGNHTSEFSALLQTLGTTRKEIAFGLCVPYHTLEKYFLGQISFPPDLIKPLYSLTRDRRIVEFFVPDPFFLRRKSSREIKRGDPVKEAYDVGVAAGEAMKIVRDALLDGRLTPPEHDAIHKALDALEKEISHVHESIG